MRAKNVARVTQTGIHSKLGTRQERAACACVHVCVPGGSESGARSPLGCAFDGTTETGVAWKVKRALEKGSRVRVDPRQL